MTQPETGKRPAPAAATAPAPAPAAPDSHQPRVAVLLTGGTIGSGGHDAQDRLDYVDLAKVLTDEQALPLYTFPAGITVYTRRFSRTRSNDASVDFWLRLHPAIITFHHAVQSQAQDAYKPIVAGVRDWEPLARKGRAGVLTMFDTFERASRGAGMHLSLWLGDTATAELTVSHLHKMHSKVKGPIIDSGQPELAALYEMYASTFTHCNTVAIYPESGENFLEVNNRSITKNFLPSHKKVVKPLMFLYVKLGLPVTGALPGKARISMCKTPEQSAAVLRAKKRILPLA